jgi:hypothetical protein
MTNVEILLKEYDTVREESLTTITVRSGILAFGLATTVGAFAVLTLLPVNSEVPERSGLPNFVRMVTVIGIPAITTGVLWMWFGEYQRMQRAGRFVAELEQRINQAAGADLLTFESHLRAQPASTEGSKATGCNKHLRYPYYATIVLLTTLGLGSAAAGLIYGQSAAPIWTRAAFVASVIAQLATLVYLCLGIKRCSH